MNLNLFITQSRMGTETPQVRGRLRYMDSDPALRAIAMQGIAAYLVGQPAGTEVTLAVLSAIGPARVRDLATGLGREEGAIRQDIGAWVALLLAERFGAERVETLRKLTTRGWVAANRPIPKDPKWQHLRWVTSYTQHLVTRPGAPSRWRIDAVAHANREGPLVDRYAVYPVWQTLLASLPDRMTSQEAHAYGRMLFYQADWSEGPDLDVLLQRKIASLADSPLRPEARAMAQHLWEEHVKRHRTPPGLGRFSTLARRSGLATAPFLAALKALCAPGRGEQQAHDLAREIAADESLPFLRVPTFSECLHLCRPQAFPIVSERLHERSVVADLLGYDPPASFWHRRQYVHHLDWMEEAQRRLGLRGPNALDSFLLQLSHLYHPRFPIGYQQEMERVRDEVPAPANRPLVELGGAAEASEEEMEYGTVCESMAPGQSEPPPSPFRTNPRLVPVILREDPVLPLGPEDWPQQEA